MVDRRAFPPAFYKEGRSIRPRWGGSGTRSFRDMASNGCPSLRCEYAPGPCPRTRRPGCPGRCRRWRTARCRCSAAPSSWLRPWRARGCAAWLPALPGARLPGRIGRVGGGYGDHPRPAEDDSAHGRPDSALQAQWPVRMRRTRAQVPHLSRVGPVAGDRQQPGPEGRAQIAHQLGERVGEVAVLAGAEAVARHVEGGADVLRLVVQRGQ